MCAGNVLTAQHLQVTRHTCTEVCMLREDRKVWHLQKGGSPKERGHGMRMGVMGCCVWMSQIKTWHTRNARERHCAHRHTVIAEVCMRSKLEPESLDSVKSKGVFRCLLQDMLETHTRTTLQSRIASPFCSNRSARNLHSTSRKRTSTCLPRRSVSRAVSHRTKLVQSATAQQYSEQQLESAGAASQTPQQNAATVSPSLGPFVRWLVAQGEQRVGQTSQDTIYKLFKTACCRC